MDHTLSGMSHGLNKLDKYLSTTEASRLDREDVKLLDDLNEFLEDGQQRKAANEQGERRYGILLELGKDEALKHASRKMRKLLGEIRYGCHHGSRKNLVI